jgi:hypothetical protein
MKAENTICCWMVRSRSRGLTVIHFIKPVNRNGGDSTCVDAFASIYR